MREGTVGVAVAPQGGQVGGGRQGDQVAPDGAAQPVVVAPCLLRPAQGVVDQGKASDQKALDLVSGKGNLVDVATSVSQTQVAVEGLVAVRDRVISAYEDIMKMPI